MSSRSGKRIHTSLLEDTAPAELEQVVRSERKTRSKRVKENSEELSVTLFKNKKRNNYVRYPTDDELLGDTTANKDVESKPSRVLRKNALREQNPQENVDQLEVHMQMKSVIRKSRRGKKVDDTDESENHENVPFETKELPKSKKIKKKKGENNVVDKPLANEEAPSKKSKKKKKKGKKTSSTIVEDIPVKDNSRNGTFNKSMSIDSFHSAAGSPDYKHDSTDTIKVTKIEDMAEKLQATNKKKSKKDTAINISIDKNDIKKYETSKKRKSFPIDEIASDQCYVSLQRDNLEKDLENILHGSNGQLKARKSIIKETTLDKNNISAIDNNETEVESNLNVSNKSNRQSKRRKSNLKEERSSLTEKVSEGINNDTFDKDILRNTCMIKDSSIVKETTETNIDTDLNISNISSKSIKKRKSITKDTTFERSNNPAMETDLNVSKKNLKGRKSIAANSTFDKSSASTQNNTQDDLNISNISNKIRSRKSNLQDTTFDKQESKLNTTFEKVKDSEDKKDSTFNKNNSKHLNATYEKELDLKNMSYIKDKKSSVNTTYDKIDKPADSTFEKDISTSFNSFKKGALTRRSSIRDESFNKHDLSVASLTKEDFEKDVNIISSSGTKRRSLRRNTFEKNDPITENGNTTFEKIEHTESEPKRKSLRSSKSADIQIVLNTTFEKDNTEDGRDNINSDSKTSLISSDNSNVMEKSNISHISITSDDTSENIVNITPLLIESSVDESHMSITKAETPKPQTPLKREGTFTKDCPEVATEIEGGTPTKRNSSIVPAAGCTPYHITKSSQKKSMLNVTRSLEKGFRATVDPAPRMTRVMFCSPVDNPVTFTTEKRKVIKSNLKGSNKSFVFEESAPLSRPGRKRSYTQSDAEDARAKRSRLTEDLQQSVDRLSRPRTASATAKLSVATPKKATTPSKPLLEGKPPRTKLPNFAALHQKQFEKMESLDECQQRRAKRAKQLLTPTAPPGLLDRISPKSTTESPKGKEQPKPKEKTDTPTKKLPTLESLRPGFTRFGFKLNLDVNPFSIPSKTAEKPKEKPGKLNGVIPPRAGVLPSLTGATSVRREVAKSTVMREKSFTDRRSLKRNENRTVIKGVRTNRRFELQMKMRNIE